jgi:glycosyltransferase involved in cell wall biosynthesis
MIQERARGLPQTLSSGSLAARPRILAVERFSRGGLFHYTAQLTQGLARQGADVTLLTGRDPETGGTGLAGVRVLDRLRGWNPHRRSRWLPRRVLRAGRGLVYLAGWMQIVATVRRERPEVVLFGDFEHRCDAWFIAWLARRGWALADIWHNVVSFDRFGGQAVVRAQPWRDRMARHFQCIFVHGENLARQFEATTGCRAVVIPHGNQNWIAGQAGPDPDLDRRLHLTPGRPVALLFGSLTRYKGIDVLIEALGLLPSAQRPTVVIAGFPLADCPIDALRARAERCGLTPWMRWQTGYIPTPEIAWYFRRADVVVLPYRAASQSGVAHLALTFGKPMIVTDTGSLPELMEGESNGLVVPPGDAPALAAALARISSDDGMRQRMGAAAHRLAETRHNWDDIARQVLAALPIETADAPCIQPAQTGAVT